MSDNFAFRVVATLQSLRDQSNDIQDQVDEKAGLNSPIFTGIPSAPTASLGTNTTQIATTQYVRNEVAALVDSAPAALDTLNELAAALGDDPNFATTVTNALSLKAPIASPTFTGIPAAPTAVAGTNTTQVATTAFVQTAISGFEALPDQTGNSGKYLTTDGTTASWDEVVGGGGGIQTDVALSNSWWLGV